MRTRVCNLQMSLHNYMCTVVHRDAARHNRLMGTQVCKHEDAPGGGQDTRILMLDVYSVKYTPTYRTYKCVSTGTISAHSKYLVEAARPAPISLFPLYLQLTRILWKASSISLRDQ